MVSAANVPAALEVTGLSVQVHRRRLLDGIDLRVGQGEWLGVIGPNGAGKSTLLRSIAGLVSHTGRIRVAGGRRPRPCEVALMPQSPALPSGMTVAEYVLLGRTAHLGWLHQESRRDRHVVVEVLRRLELVGFADRMVDSLSGGEAQRVVVARALAQQSPVLLLDEPTSALDVGHQVEVLELVDELRCRDGLTVISAMHDLGAAGAYADRLLLLAHGVMVVTDAPNRVLDPVTLSGVYGTALDVHRLNGQFVVVPAVRSPGPRAATPASLVGASTEEIR